MFLCQVFHLSSIYWIILVSLLSCTWLYIIYTYHLFSLNLFLYPSLSKLEGKSVHAKIPYKEAQKNHIVGVLDILAGFCLVMHILPTAIKCGVHVLALSLLDLNKITMKWIIIASCLCNLFLLVVGRAVPVKQRTDHYSSQGEVI